MSKTATKKETEAVIGNAGVGVKYSVNGSKLTIEIDTSKNFGTSKSGKSTIIASTQGNVTLLGTDNVKMGLNIYRPA